MLTVLAVGLGLILGSFLSVLLERLPAGRQAWGPAHGIISGRSECPDCHHVLAWYDLVPLASWAFLAGRCRYCGARISALYPALELAMAAVFGLYVLRYGFPSAWQAGDLVILFGLVALFFFDLRHRILPDVITLPLIVFVLVRLFTMRPDLLANALATGTLLAALCGLLYLLSHGRAIGLGDVKLAFLIGALSGYPLAVGVTLLAIWAGALAGVGLMLAGRATMKTALPFGSFWTAAAVASVIWVGKVSFLSGLVIPALK